MNTPYNTESPGNSSNEYLDSYQLTSDSEDADQWGNIWEAPESSWDDL